MRRHEGLYAAWMPVSTRNTLSVCSGFLGQQNIGPRLRHLLRADAADMAVVIAVEPVEQSIRVDAAPDVTLAPGESELGADDGIVGRMAPRAPIARLEAF